MVDGFANQLFEEMNALNINQGEIKKFQTVFDELIRNAFNHGCKEEQGCKVKIKCTYSVWFIKVEISDTGKGFDFNHQLVQTDTDIHGLQVVRRLANRISANRKGNSLTALLLNTQELNFSTDVEKYRNKEILTIKVNSQKTWSYTTASWKPISDTTTLANQNLVLIDFIDVTEPVEFTTHDRRKMGKMFTEFQAHDNKFYAIIVNADIWLEYDLAESDSDRARYFPDKAIDKNSNGFVKAKNWLVKQSTKKQKRKPKKRKTEA